MNMRPVLLGTLIGIAFAASAYMGFNLEKPDADRAEWLGLYDMLDKGAVTGYQHMGAILLKPDDGLLIYGFYVKEARFPETVVDDYCNELKRRWNKDRHPSTDTRKER